MAEPIPHKLDYHPRYRREFRWNWVRVIEIVYGVLVATGITICLIDLLGWAWLQATK